MTLLKLTNVNKRFGGVVAAKDVSFEVHEGEIMGLIGPNGAGKSTILNLISGIYDCDGGSIVFLDKDVTKVKSFERSRMGIARTFQTPHFLKRSSVLDNMLLGNDLYEQRGYLKSFLSDNENDFDTEIQELLKIADLQLDWDMDITAIPYGQQKRLEIVRGLLSKPKLMLIDEPAAGLNEKELEKVSDLVRYAVSKGVGVILIEHKMDMVLNLCDSIAVLSFGEVISKGTPKEISNDPVVIEAYLGKDE